MSHSKYRQISCGLTKQLICLFSLCRLRNTTGLRFGTVDKSKWPVFLQNASGNALFVRATYVRCYSTPWGHIAHSMPRWPSACNTCNTYGYLQHFFNFNCTKSSSRKATWRSLPYDMPHFETLVASSMQFLSSVLCIINCQMHAHNSIPIDRHFNECLIISTNA